MRLLESGRLLEDGPGFRLGGTFAGSAPGWVVAGVGGVVAGGTVVEGGTAGVDGTGVSGMALGAGAGTAQPAHADGSAVPTTAGAA